MKSKSGDSGEHQCVLHKGLQCQNVLLRLSQSVRRDSQTSRAMLGSIGSGALTILGVIPENPISRL